MKEQGWYEVFEEANQVSHSLHVSALCAISEEPIVHHTRRVFDDPAISYLQQIHELKALSVSSRILCIPALSVALFSSESFSLACSCTTSS